MLTQIVGANIHQFHRVQRAAPVPGVQARVGRGAVERVPHTCERHAFSGPHIADIVGVPGEGRVTAVKQVVPGHQDFALHRLLRRAAVKPDRSRQLLPRHTVLQNQGRSQNRRSQGAVPTGVAGRPLLAWAAHGTFLL